MDAAITTRWTWRGALLALCGLGLAPSALHDDHARQVAEAKTARATVTRIEAQLERTATLVRIGALERELADLDARMDTRRRAQLR